MAAVGAPMFHHAIGPGDLCNGCASAGRVLIHPRQRVRKVRLAGLGRVQVCPVCDQHPNVAPSWRHIRKEIR
ncbi:hypothetical protein NE236_41475 [Actinoallomurus purpureus]|uniref:hypothetical protein n=1 Tax=Actinoallomurus purpureus TaxID=478114 RepID=UPI002092D253|nr:hypothetical protein [Actinoallomurus purpureus]MCO6011440.1 hypothetical protein [Actinoallomurus purpureus]